MQHALPPRRRRIPKRRQRSVAVTTVIVRGDAFTARQAGPSGLVMAHRGTLDRPLSTGISGRPVAQIRYHEDVLVAIAPMPSVVMELTPVDTSRERDKAVRLARKVAGRLGLRLEPVDGEPWCFIVHGDNHEALLASRHWRLFVTRALPVRDTTGNIGPAKRPVVSRAPRVKPLDAVGREMANYNRPGGKIASNLPSHV